MTVSNPVFVHAGTARPGDLVTVTGPEGRHGAAVRRLRPGEPVDLVDGAGGRATGTVADVTRDAFTVRVDAVSHEPERRPRLVVVQALAKGDRAEAAVETLTECGVDEIVPWAAHRSVAVWRGAKVDRGPDRWRAVARAAAKQSRRSRFPVIGALATSAAVAERLRGAAAGLVLHETAPHPLARVDVPRDGDVVVVVGPEGGIDDGELAQFAAAGAQQVRLGPTVMRTSTAGTAAVAALSAASGRWE